jgi:putative salt-induced outer membrane protein YdiY
MKNRSHKLPALAALLAAVAANPLRARADDPKYEFGKQAEVKTVEWKASVQAGFLYTTGNSNTASISGGATASRNDGKNKVSLDVAGAYARSTILQSNLGSDHGTGMIDTTINRPDEIKSVPKITAANVTGKLRYDRFFTANNSGYVSYYVGLDQPAGKDFFTGGQVGYARQIVHTPRHLLSGEVGYDIAYTDFIAPVGTYSLLHSARLFVGYTLTINDSVGLAASVETMINGNSVTIAKINYGFAEASRLIGKVSLNTRIWKNISFKVGFTARYDNAPAAAPALDVPYGPDFLPLANRLDTMTDASLIITFL